MSSLRGHGAIGVCVVVLAGCNPAGGFVSAGNALVPDQKSYLEQGGTRLIAGSFYDLHLGIQPKVAAYLTARPGQRGDGGRALSVIDAQHQSQCQLSDVAAYDADFARRDMPALTIGYLESSDDSGQGALRFADPLCHPLGLSVPSASWPPLDATAKNGFAVRSAGGLSFADVALDSVRPLVSSFVAAYPLASEVADGGYLFEWVVQGDGQVVLFDQTWHEQARFGSGVDGVAIPNGYTQPEFSAYYTDSAGLHALELFPLAPDTDTDKLVEPGACQVHPGYRGSDGLDSFEGVVYHSPCSDPALVTRTGRIRYQFAIAGDPSLTRVLITRSDMPLVATLSDPVPGTSRGSLSIATPSAFSSDTSDELEPLDSLYAPLPLGTEYPIADGVEYAWLQWASVPYALANSDGTSGDLITFDVSVDASDPQMVIGPTLLASQVLITSEIADKDHTYPDLNYDELLINAAGGVADLAAPCRSDCAGVHVSAPRVPIHGFLAQHDDYFTTSVESRWQGLLLTDFDGASGTLHLAQYWQDDTSTMPVLATGVAPGKFALLDQMQLPGAAFISNVDAASGAGRLEYDNVDLGFRATIHEGVSELLPVLWPESGLIFVVPSGSDAGIWVSIAK
ncbi:MAG TPA: hypothetical protein VGM29_08035 [Polyangiaceae bacterium]|jgi:hypothetical protein